MANQFNHIFRSNKTPDEWRRSILVSIYKNKGDIQSCTNYRKIKLMSHTIPIRIGLHQGSALSPYLFALVIDEVTRDIQGDIPWCMLFADDVVLVDESRT